MTAKPQLDTAFLNEFIARMDKKTDDLFLVNRLKNTVIAVDKNNKSEGCGALIDYYIYTNNFEEALDVFERRKYQYSSNPFLLKAGIRLYTALGEWNLLKKSWNDYINSLNEVNKEKYIFSLLSESAIFLDIEPYFDFKDFIPKDFFTSRVNYINNSLEKLENLDISIENYRKLVGLSYQITYRSYNLHKFDYILNCNDEFVSILIQNPNWSNEDVKELNIAFMQAISEIDDVDFHCEVNEIDVLFINCDYQKIPKNIRIFEDTDDDLISLIEKRMSEDTQEYVKIEVDNV